MKLGGKGCSDDFSGRVGGDWPAVGMLCFHLRKYLCMISCVCVLLQCYFEWGLLEVSLLRVSTCPSSSSFFCNFIVQPLINLKFLTTLL